jgi:hypothetical protein
MFPTTVTDFHIQKKTVPTSRKHLPIMKENTVFLARSAVFKNNTP